MQGRRMYKIVEKKYTKIMRYFTSILWYIFFSSIMATPEPLYETIKQDNEFELRRYSSMVLIQTNPKSESQSSHFRVLVNYINGKNSQAKKIPMTAPVLTTGEKDRERMMFVLPDNITLKEAPSPQSNEVDVFEFESLEVVTIRFNGRTSKRKVEQKTKLLLKWAIKNNIDINQTQLFIARYNPPWTLPMNRRNEIWIRVIKAGK